MRANRNRITIESFEPFESTVDSFASPPIVDSFTSSSSSFVRSSRALAVGSRDDE